MGAPATLSIEDEAGNAHLPLDLQMGEWIVGRGDAAQPVDLDLTNFQGVERGVSRQHAYFIYQQGSVYLVDLDSYNGTYLNGLQLQSGKMYRLRHGDEVEFGQLRAVFRLASSGY